MSRTNQFIHKVRTDAQPVAASVRWDIPDAGNIKLGVRVPNAGRHRF